VIGSFRTALPTVTCPERSVSRASEAAAKRQDTAAASITLGWRYRDMEVPMPAVQNAKSRAMGFYNGGRRGRGRRAKGVCSWIVLAVFGLMGLSSADTGGIKVKVFLAAALPTVNGPERSVSRASEAAAKRQDTAAASITLGWR
jgi:hypothetical protein